MSIIEINQKIKKIQDLCYKLNEIDFKDYCITNQFKNLKRSPSDFDYVKNNVADAISKYLFQKTAKKPMVIPVIIGV